MTVTNDSTPSSIRRPGTVPELLEELLAVMVEWTANFLAGLDEGFLSLCLNIHGRMGIPIENSKQSD
jgi:hypothetical protein